MIRLEKVNQLDRITDENARTRLVNEIKASGPVLKLIDQIITDRINYFECTLETKIASPYELAAHVHTIAELRKLTKLFKDTEE